MGGGDVLIVMGVVALIFIMLDGKRRMHKRAVAAQVPPRSKTPHQLTSPSMAPQQRQSKAPAKASLPTLPTVAITQCLPASSGTLSGNLSGTLIGSTLRIQGKLNAEEPLVIRGSIDGDVMASKHLVTITESGSVSRYIEARTISVAGRVAGRLVATDQAMLLASACVSGSIEARRLRCDHGAWLQATVSVTALSHPGHSATR